MTVWGSIFHACCGWPLGWVMAGPHLQQGGRPSSVWWIRCCRARTIHWRHHDHGSDWWRASGQSHWSPLSSTVAWCEGQMSVLGGKCGLPGSSSHWRQWAPCHWCQVESHHWGSSTHQHLVHSWDCSTTMVALFRFMQVSHKLFTSYSAIIRSRSGPAVFSSIPKAQGRSCILPLKLAGDASPYGVGAVISHIMEDGSGQPVAFASRSLSQSESNYSQIEKRPCPPVFINFILNLLSQVYAHDWPQAADDHLWAKARNPGIGCSLPSTLGTPLGSLQLHHWIPTHWPAWKCWQSFPDYPWGHWRELSLRMTLPFLTSFKSRAWCQAATQTDPVLSKILKSEKWVGTLQWRAKPLLDATSGIGRWRGGASFGECVWLLLTSCE